MDNSCQGRAHLLSELRIVLLGGSETGKSSTGNTILGREAFLTERRTAVCAERQGKVGPWQVAVVDTPGWWCDFNVRNTPESVKQEIVHSASLCPQAFLVVIDVDESFTEAERRSVEEHLELLSERVWRNTIVLFTWGDWLGDTSIEQHIENKGEALQWLIEKCGNRYHVLNNKNRNDATQVQELLEKTEQMVAGNSDCPLAVNSMLLLKMAERKKDVEEGAKQRLKKVQQQRENLSSLLIGVSHQLAEVRIALLGSRNTGKSSAGNTILGREEFATERRTARCLRREGEAGGRRVTVVDTPGWLGDSSVNQTPELEKREIMHSVVLCPPGPHAFLLGIDVSTSFTEEQRRSVEEHLELLSERVWGHTMVLFTWGDWLGDTSIEHWIESEGKAIQWLIEKCGNRYHVINNRDWRDSTQVTELLEKIEGMVAGSSGGPYEVEKSLLDMEKKRKEVEERAQKRQTQAQEQRETLRSLHVGESHQLSEVRIVLLGSGNMGKSSAGNTILGRGEFVTEGRTTVCLRGEGEVGGRQVTVVDTPGWLVDSSTRTSPGMGKWELARSVFLCPPGPHAVLLVVEVSVSFTETHRRMMEEHLELLGMKAWSFAIVLFTNGEWLGDTSIEHWIESEGEAIQGLIEKCGNRYHVFNNRDWRDSTQVTELMEKVEGMVAGNNRGLFHFEVQDTAEEEEMGYLMDTEEDTKTIRRKTSKSYPPNSFSSRKTREPFHPCQDRKEQELYKW
ncbi:GTPase IMAP family member 8-like [Megalops cyprinoides]|uniref:GTPase IMAP family member 8-like n=1 Tax=Megalops cyprinoides TaxID=118141 RepID=UPI001863CFAC|nr:GTPase IMAP family member 8-like [Megalops cyprinoides]